MLGLCVPRAMWLWVQVAVPPMARPACGGLQRHARFRLPQLCPNLRLTVSWVEGLSSTTALELCRHPPHWGPESSPQVGQR